ncbi:MAG: type II CAAX endopeptidase family protein [Terriglobales bacterium]
MSVTIMDSNPPSPAQEPKEQPSANSPPSPGPAPASVRRGSALSAVAKIFVGPEGLYPAVRWLIYIGMGFAVLALLNSVLYSVRPESTGSLWWNLAGEVRMMLAAILPGFAMARIEGRPFGDFGLPARGAFGRNFWTGALWGLGALTVLMLALRVIGVFSFGPLHLHGVRILRLGLFYAIFFLVAALFEDFLMRGYSQWVLAKGMGFWPAAAMLSIIFGAIHGVNPGEGPTGLIAVVAIGFFFCLTLRRTGNLWWAIGFHMAWDWGESYLYSVPDSGGVARGRLLNSSLQGPSWLSGGTVGPEGSYLVFVVVAAVWVLFDRIYPEVKYGVPAGL